MITETNTKVQLPSAETKNDEALQQKNSVFSNAVIKSPVSESHNKYIPERALKAGL